MTKPEWLALPEEERVNNLKTWIQGMQTAQKDCNVGNKTKFKKLILSIADYEKE